MSLTYADPALFPFALARLDRLTYVRFALDHNAHTAYVVSTLPREAAHGTATFGVHAEIEPFLERYQADALAGCTLRLMGAPFNTQVVYGIVTNPEVLDRAENHLYLALGDFKVAIDAVATPKDALAVHQRIVLVTLHAIELERLALDRADALCGKGAA